MGEHHYGTHCHSCGASWWFAEPEPEDIECTACGETVLDLRDLGPHRGAGRNVEPS
jgi:hypothetical protein